MFDGISGQSQSQGWIAEDDILGIIHIISDGRVFLGQHQHNTQRPCACAVLRCEQGIEYGKTELPVMWSKSAARTCYCRDRTAVFPHDQLLGDTPLVWRFDIAYRAGKCQKQGPPGPVSQRIHIGFLHHALISHLRGRPVAGIIYDQSTIVPLVQQVVCRFGLQIAAERIMMKIYLFKIDKIREIRVPLTHFFSVYRKTEVAIRACREFVIRDQDHLVLPGSRLDIRFVGDDILHPGGSLRCRKHRHPANTEIYQPVVALIEPREEIVFFDDLSHIILHIQRHIVYPRSKNIFCIVSTVSH